MLRLRSVRYLILCLIIGIPIHLLPLTSGFAQDPVCDELFPPVSSPSQLTHADAATFYGRYSAAYSGGHVPRQIAELVDETRMRRDLMRMTGQLAFDDRGQLNDRYTPANRQRFRKFVVREAQALGLTPSYERKAAKSYISREDDESPLDLQNLTTLERMGLWYDYYYFRNDLRSYLINKRGFGSSSDALKNLTKDILLDIQDKVKEDPSAYAVGLRIDVEHVLRRIDQFENPPAKKPTAGDGEADPASSPVESDADLKNTVNVVVNIPGTQAPDEVIEVVVHYDSVHEGVGGADDNGAGLATALEMLRIFKANPPARTLRVVFTDQEETGGDGADLHLEKIANTDERFLGALVLDMFGYSPLGAPAFVIELGKDYKYKERDSYQDALLMTEALTHQWHKYVDRPAKLSVLTHSAQPDMGDHGSYWSEDFPAVFVAQPLQPRNPVNHSPRDKIENMNWLVFMQVARFMTESVAVLTGAHLNPEVAADAHALDFYQRALRADIENESSYLPNYLEGGNPSKPPTSLGFSKPPESVGRSASETKETQLLTASPPQLPPTLAPATRLLLEKIDAAKKPPEKASKKVKVEPTEPETVEPKEAGPKKNESGLLGDLFSLLVGKSTAKPVTKSGSGPFINKYAPPPKDESR